MKKDKFTDQFATATAEAFQKVYPDVFKSEGRTQVFDPDFIAANAEKPKDPTKGRLALPIFRYAGLLKQKPPEIATSVAEASNRILHEKNGGLTLLEIEAAGGFINARVDPVALAAETLTAVVEQENSYGSSTIGNQKKMLIEYSSPNIAKPFGVGHLRSTIVGNSLRLIFDKLGYDTTGINYLGDWGTQFGKMIVAYRKWGQDIKLNGDAVKNLYNLYVLFHKKAEENPSLDEEARQAFKDLEGGDPEAHRLWDRFRGVSQAEFNRIYKELGVHFDVTTGESFFNDKMDAIIERLEKDGLTKESQGALIVELDDDQLPPCLLKKADGATLYATRDLAGLVYRWETYKFHESLYVVGVAQSDYFKQILQVIEKMETAEGLPDDQRMSGRVKHIDFGWVKFKDKSLQEVLANDPDTPNEVREGESGRAEIMKTRAGNIILLESVLSKAIALVHERIKQKNPDLEQSGQTAHLVGAGAVTFSQLSVRRQKDIVFDWDEVLNFDGETGPYLQYTHARLCSLLRNYLEPVRIDVDYSRLAAEEEQRIIELLADFPVAVEDAARNYDPYYVSAYLLKLAGAFNKFYQRKDEQGRIDKIISDDHELTAARMNLVKSVQVVVNEGLRLLALQAPEQM